MNKLECAVEDVCRLCTELTAKCAAVREWYQYGGECPAEVTPLCKALSCESGDAHKRFEALLNASKEYLPHHPPAAVVNRACEAMKKTLNEVWSPAKLLPPELEEDGKKLASDIERCHKAVDAFYHTLTGESGMGPELTADKVKERYDDRIYDWKKLKKTDWLSPIRFDDPVLT